MAFNLPLPGALRKALWKVKIRDKEVGEHPHVTIIRGTKAWRINLRTGDFMDADPKPADVPEEILEIIRADQTSQLLRDEWDRMYPNNRVFGSDESQE